MCIAMASIGTPRAAMYAAASSQLPMCPLTSTTPRPCARAASSFSQPSVPLKAPRMLSRGSLLRMMPSIVTRPKPR